MFGHSGRESRRLILFLLRLFRSIINLHRRTGGKKLGWRKEIFPTFSISPDLSQKRFPSRGGIWKIFRNIYFLHFPLLLHISCFNFISPSFCATFVYVAKPLYFVCIFQVKIGKKIVHLTGGIIKPTYGKFYRKRAVLVRSSLDLLQVSLSLSYSVGPL
jgi:hypothetical protein